MATHQLLGQPVKVQIRSSASAVEAVQVRYRRSTGEKIVIMDLVDFYEEIGGLLKTLKEITEEQRKGSLHPNEHWVLEVSFLPQDRKAV